MGSPSASDSCTLLIAMATAAAGIQTGAVTIMENKSTLESRSAGVDPHPVTANEAANRTDRMRGTGKTLSYRSVRRKNKKTGVLRGPAGTRPPALSGPQ